MFWHLLLILLSPLTTLCLRVLRDHRDRDILALRQQVLILQRHLSKRARLTRRSSSDATKPASADSDSQLPDPRPCPDQKYLQISFGTLRALSDGKQDL